MRMGLVQCRTPATPDGALAHLMPLLTRAAESGAELIATPEYTNFLEGDPGLLRAQVRAVDDDLVVGEIRRWARQAERWVLIGSASVRPAPGHEGIVNRSLLISPRGEVAAHYDKIHLFDANLDDGPSRESAVFSAGDKAVVATAGDVRIGLTICYDVRFPHLHGALAGAGAEVIATPAAFARQTGVAHWEVLQRARAIENGCYVIAPAQTGRHEDGRETWGHTLAVDPWGRVLGCLADDKAGVLIVEVDRGSVDIARQQIPALKNRRSFNSPDLSSA